MCRTESSLAFYLVHRPIQHRILNRHSSPLHPITTPNKKNDTPSSPLFLLDTDPPSTTRPATTATETTTPHITIYRRTTARSAHGALAALLASLDGDTGLLAIPYINPNTALTALWGGKRSGDRTARSVDSAKLQECTCLVSHEIEIFDGSKTSG
jgi:hypothetical protein